MPARATVTIGSRHELLRDHVVVRDLQCLAPALLDRPLQAQTRAHGATVGATLDGARVSFDCAVPRVAPGQVVVLYADDVVVASGFAG